MKNQHWLIEPSPVPFNDIVGWMLLNAPFARQRLEPIRRNGRTQNSRNHVKRHTITTFALGNHLCGEIKTRLRIREDQIQCLTIRYRTLHNEAIDRFVVVLGIIGIFDAVLQLVRRAMNRGGKGIFYLAAS
ncbi:hypothetical protein LB504_008669 [Fusarium proliferatum]|nr:hypothetical protein LB504_008669 [Fusarium proliferatum]